MQPIGDRYLTVLVEIEQRLLVCHDLHSCYDKMLELLGKAVQASRSYLVEATHPPHFFSTPIAEWRAVQHICSAPCLTCDASAHRADAYRLQAHESDMHHLDWQTLPDSTLAAWMATLRQGDLVVEWFPMPSEQAQGTPRSVAMVLLPLLVEGNLYGMIGLECWPQQSQNATALKHSAIQMLKGAAVALALKLEQQQQQARVTALTQQIQQLQNNLAEAAQQHTLCLQKALNFEALLKRITDRVRDSLDERQILQTAVQELAIGLGAHSCDTALYDLEHGTSTIVHEYINCEAIAPARGVCFQLADYPDIYPRLLQGEPLQFCWIAPPTTPRNLKTRLVVLGCPIIDDQGVIGDLWLYDRVEAYFEIEAVRLIEQVANQCAIALRQARLYQSAQAKVQKLEHLNYLKDDFLNTVSHELRSPMANIEMATQMLEMLLFNAPPLLEAGKEIYPTAPVTASVAPSPPTHSQDGSSPASELLLAEGSAMIPHPASFQQALRYFRMLQEECLRETNLINNLLDLSRLEAGTEPIFLTPIHLQIWLPHVVEPFLERARSQQQQLQIDVPGDLPPLSTDLFGLERILTELLHNACKYTPAGEAIRLSAWLEPVRRRKPARNTKNTLVEAHSGSAAALQCNTPHSPPAATLFLQISNSGVEIPVPELPRIFDKFYRIPDHDLWKQGGTGLGLALVKRLVEHLGATIEVDSRHNQVIFTIGFSL